MNRCTKFALVFLTALALSSLATHAIIRALGIVTFAMPFPPSGTNYLSTPLVAAGSSLITYGLDWDRVAREFSRPVKILATPAASPCELELLAAAVPTNAATILGIAASDMDEEVLSDFRSENVPLARTWQDLRESHADGTLARRTLGQYPLRYLRVLYPTAGRSTGVLVGFRQAARAFIHRHASSISEPLPTFNNAAGWPTNKISDWDSGRLLRNTSQQRGLSAERHSFDGPKRLALERMLRVALARGKAIIVVMPNSPIYNHDVINDSIEAEFQKELGEIAREFPAVQWIRLDQIPALQSDALYWDLVHLNADGRPVASNELLRQLKPILRAP
jgi:hypothetical protein